MHRFLPLSFLIVFLALFGISWIVVGVDPDTAPWYIFAVLILLIFIFIFSFLGTILYFIRTRFYRRYSANWYVKTSFKMAFFIAVFISLLAILAILQMITTITSIAAILAVALLAVWSYLGKSGKS